MTNTTFEQIIAAVNINIKAVDPTAGVDPNYGNLQENGSARVCVEYDLFGPIENGEGGFVQQFQQMGFVVEENHGSIGAGMYSSAWDAVAGYIIIPNAAEWLKQQ